MLFSASNEEYCTIKEAKACISKYGRQSLLIVAICVEQWDGDCWYREVFFAICLRTSVASLADFVQMTGWNSPSIHNDPFYGDVSFLEVKAQDELHEFLS